MYINNKITSHEDVAGLVLKKYIEDKEDSKSLIQKVIEVFKR